MKHLLLYFLLTVTVAVTTFSATAQFNDDMDDVFGKQQPEFLKVDEAFGFDFSQQDGELALQFTIADGYYLYKKQFKFVSKDAELGEATFPQGVMIEDEFFGTSEVFYDDLTIRIPVARAAEDALVKVRYQGCADAGLCYPPTIKQVYLSAVNDASAPAANSQDVVKSEQFSLAERLLNNDSMVITLLLFLALGIGLAFTPCVFPMYPIISGIVVGQGTQGHWTRTLWLSVIYVQGMALTYSLLGLVVASAGMQFQAALQHPVLLGALIVIFVLLALAMFGTYELQLPSSWQARLTGLSNAQTRGSLLGVFIMGALSGLIASPCTTAPLTGVLLFIAQSGDMLLGFVALYVLSLGMGLPLIAFAVTGGKLLPKAGNWMNIVKVTFGFMMLVVAVVFIERLWNSAYTDLLYALLGLAAFSYYQVMNQASQTTLAKGIRTLVIFVGLFASAMLAYQTLFNHSGASSSAASSSSAAHSDFVRVKNLEDFNAKLAAANAEGKSVMVDLYADWCVACKEFEKYTFGEPAVIEALDNTVWMQIDLTENTPTNLAFQKEFDVLGLPTILFFDRNGREVPQSRVTGFMQAAPFAAHVKQVLSD